MTETADILEGAALITLKIRCLIDGDCSTPETSKLQLFQISPGACCTSGQLLSLSLFRWW